MLSHEDDQKGPSPLIFNSIRLMTSFFRDIFNKLTFIFF